MKNILAAVAIVLTGLTAWLLACGPFVTDLDTVQAIAPPSLADYARGDLGVVRPRFARRYLVQAYRGFSGQPPLAISVPDASAAGLAPSRSTSGDQPAPIEAWADARDRILGTTMTTEQRYRLDSSRFREIGGQFQDIENCPNEAFATAVRTLKARTERFGASSAALRDWTRAQAAVFANCPKSPLSLPAALPASADALLKADRAYQTAAAYFYATEYEESARLFRSIATDASSPWRPYGRYLAARAMIRLATVPEDKNGAVDRSFGAAETDLRAVLDDAGASELHRSARGLLGLVAARRRPVERLHELSKVLATSRDVSEQDLTDYRWLMDKFVGNTVDYDYEGVKRRDDIVQNDDLDDWVLAIQGQGEPALARAASRWQQSHTLPWLIALLWKAPADLPVASAALEAARSVDSKSPAYPTVAFLRVRWLMRLGRRDEARSILAALPRRPETGFNAETVNLLAAERLLVADTLDEFLANAPRAIVLNDAGLRYDKPSFDDDAGEIFTHRLPLDRLVDAATSTVLPARLRLRVAIAAFTRAVVLARDDAGGRVVPALRALAPPLGADLDRYVNAATSEERHLAGILLLLRTPGMHADVLGREDDVAYEVVDPARKFDHVFRRNWWCGLDKPRKPDDFPSSSELLGLLYAGGEVPAPAFVTADERAAAEREIRSIGALGDGRVYLATEAIKWAHARPKDENAAEALAHAVEGWRWGCSYDESKWQLSQQVFTTLHQLFPQSKWAKQTRYWYR